MNELERFALEAAMLLPYMYYRKMVLAHYEFMEALLYG